MTRTVRILRIALPLLFIAFLIVVIFSFTANERSDRVAGDVATDLPRDERPQRIGDRFALTQTVSGRTVLRIVADRTVGFESGWYTLEGVQLTVFRAGGRTYEISAKQAQVHQDTRELEAIGGVTLRSGDGIVVQTQELRFDGRQLLGRHPLTFRMGPWTGKAGGLVLDVSAETVKLTGGVEGAKPAAEGEQPISFRSRQADFHRAAGELSLSGGVVIHRGADRFTSNSATAVIDLETEELRALRGEGEAAIHLAQGPATGSSSGTLNVSAERFTGEFDESGQLASMQAFGSPARAELAGPPPRLITAPSFRLQLSAGDLREVHATGGVRVVETQPDGDRIIDSTVASAVIDPATGQASTVQANGNVRFSEPRVSGTGDRAIWDLGLRRIVITSDAPRLATARTAEETLRARRFDVDLDSSTLTAHEQVYAALRSSARGSDAVFAGDAPVMVNADLAILRQREGIAIFRENVRAWQGEDTLFANELRVVEGEGVLTASGGVRTQLHQRQAGGPQTGPIRTTSRMLIARRAENHVTLEGDVTVAESGRIVASDRATVEIAAEGGGLKRVVAEGNVRLRETATGREGGGTRVLYTPADETIVLFGEPARISDARGEVRGEQILFDLGRNTVEVLSSGTEPTEATYNPPSR